MIAKSTLSLGAIVFWIIILFVPHGSGENYFHLLGWVLAGAVSTLSTLPGLYFALKAKRDIGWWLICLLDLSPIVWFLLAPYYYLATPGYD